MIDIFVCIRVIHYEYACNRLRILCFFFLCMTIKQRSYLITEESRKKCVPDERGFESSKLRLRLEYIYMILFYVNFKPGFINAIIYILHNIL